MRHTIICGKGSLFPIEAFYNWNADDEKDPAVSKGILQKLLPEFYLQPIAREALYIRSPDLYEPLLLWLDHKIDKPEKKKD